jgi:hypothetical protein
MKIKEILTSTFRNFFCYIIKRSIKTKTNTQDNISKKILRQKTLNQKKKLTNMEKSSDFIINGNKLLKNSIFQNSKNRDDMY